MFADIQHLLDKLPQDPCDMTFDEFIAKLGVSENVYILSIQSSLQKAKVFSKCSVNDICINPYIKHLLHTRQANHDIQFTLDIYSLIVYVCDYMTMA